MTTGDKPPGSKTGDTFVHDPKASDCIAMFVEFVIKLKEFILKLVTSLVDPNRKLRNVLLHEQHLLPMQQLFDYRL